MFILSLGITLIGRMCNKRSSDPTTHSGPRLADSECGEEGLWEDSASVQYSGIEGSSMIQKEA